MPARLRICAVVCLAAALGASTWSAPPARALEPAAWREDLAALDHAVRTNHASPFHTVSEDEFAAMVARLDRDIEGLTDQEIIVRLASIVAAVNDGHTRLDGWLHDPRWGFRSYPVALHWFEDGLFVRQAHPEYADLAGARVVGVGRLTPEEAQARLEAVAAADNRFGERAATPRFMISPEVLVALDILESPDDPPFRLERDGRQFTPDLVPIAAGDRPHAVRGFMGEDWADAADSASAPRPPWRRHVEQTFWMEYLPLERMLYVQQNQVRDAPTETLESFYGRVAEELRTWPVEKLVLDLRLNGGGNNYLNRPALTTLIRAEPDVQTFTVIGRSTFSACQNLVNELSRWTDTVFVGEPTGERVNFYGDTRDTALPHSGLDVRVSWLWWQNMDPRDTRDALYPDLFTGMSSGDYAANRDPALAAIREFDGLADQEQLLALLEAEGAGAVGRAVAAALDDPRFRYREFEQELNALGYELMGAHRLEEAIAVFELNVGFFPDSWNVYDSLGEAREAAGDRDRARELFRKSLELNPDSPTGRAALQRLDGGDPDPGG